ncbi:AMIN-like domain-containing (lipo)protein [Nesterenkonia aurantiaca]|uniref:AMIN-like domain-containing protein n=1 Tax=Nesterenkonia aurantiaca TaxID=1436010 RepID=A0A4R7G768_9MICC|nr:hypothetical protein [Nesterenkonia aurantiaca]TDS87374.1 hypothetical protein EV640_101158 [Nesterenkonia aurantiaca]
MSPRDAFLPTAAIAAALALSSCGSPEDELPQDDPTQHSAGQAEESAEPTESAETDGSAEPSSGADADESEQPAVDEGGSDPETDEPDADESDADAAETDEPDTDEADTDEADTDEASEEEAPEAADLSDFSTQPQPSEDYADFMLDVSHDTVQVLSEIRLGSHAGYERIVLEYALDTGLAHQAQYIEPGEQGTGFTEVQDGAVEAMLLIDVLGTTGGPDAEAAAWSEAWSPETDAAMVREIQPGELAGGESQVLISLDQQRDFRVQQLTDPVRIVVDIAQE